MAYFGEIKRKTQNLGLIVDKELVLGEEYLVIFRIA
jgi:hypothetical protein